MVPSEKLKGRGLLRGCFLILHFNGCHSATLLLSGTAKHINTLGNVALEIFLGVRINIHSKQVSTMILQHSLS